MITDRDIQNELDARSLRYAIQAIKKQYSEAKRAQNLSLNATPIDWDGFIRRSGETFALAGALGALGQSLPEVAE